MENIDTGAAFLIAIFVVFSAFYVINFVTTPHRLGAETNEAITALQSQLNISQTNKPLAEPLREKMQEIDSLIREKPGALVEFRYIADVEDWEESIKEIMREGGLGEDEIQMFETISDLTINDPTSLYLDLQASKKYHEALEKKREQLRLIINRLPKEV